MNPRLPLAALSIALATSLAACARGGAETAAEAPAAQAAAAANPGNKGKVVQFVNGGGYTYAEVEVAGGGKVWIAGSAIAVKPGSTVEWGNAMVMQNFEAKSLGRRFEQILFVDGWAPVGQQQVAVSPHGQLPAPQLSTSSGAGPAAAGGNPGAGTVKTVTNAGGYSYIEVDQGGALVWVAAMEAPIKAGDKVRWESGTEMSNFTARSISRTFERIIFAQSVTVGK